MQHCNHVTLPRLNLATIHLPIPTHQSTNPPIHQSRPRVTLQRFNALTIQRPFNSSPPSPPPTTTARAKPKPNASASASKPSTPKSPNADSSATKPRLSVPHSQLCT